MEVVEVQVVALNPLWRRLMMVRVVEAIAEVEVREAGPQVKGPNLAQMKRETMTKKMIVKIHGLEIKRREAMIIKRQEVQSSSSSRKLSKIRKSHKRNPLNLRNPTSSLKVSLTTTPKMRLR